MVETVFYDAPVMLAIARCESGYIHYQDDGMVIRGRVHPPDVGVMQINQKAHGERLDALGLDAEDIHDNLTFARLLYDEQGQGPWVCKKQIALAQ